MCQITCFTVVQMLDHIFKSGSPMVDSVYGKKKRKLAENRKSYLLRDGIHLGENALSFLSSLLDILLLKKDIANRFSSFDVSLFLLQFLSTRNF